MDVKLIIANGKLAGKEIRVAGPKFRIGRGEMCQLRPQSHSVSRKHCLIRVEPALVSIEDYGSTNGTFVNNEKILQRQELKNGDVIRVGLLELQVELTVGIGGKKKPAIQSVQEAAARTVATSAKDDNFDISGWLAEDNSPKKASPAETLPGISDTLAGTSMIETTTIPAPHIEMAKQEEDKKKATAPKPPGKLQRQVKPIGDNCGQAAAEVLRQFFQRKKP